MKKLTLAVTIVLLIVLALATTVQASPPGYLYLEKECIDWSDECQIISSNVEELEGGEIIYFNYHAAVGDFFSVEVAINVPDGSARGQFVWVGDHGYFSIQDGEGSLKGFHAQGKISWIEDTFVFPLEGRYHFDP